MPAPVISTIFFALPLVIYLATPSTSRLDNVLGCVLSSKIDELSFPILICCLFDPRFNVSKNLRSFESEDFFCKFYQYFNIKQAICSYFYA